MKKIIKKKENEGIQFQNNNSNYTRIPEIVTDWHYALVGGEKNKNKILLSQKFRSFYSFPLFTIQPT